MNLETNNPNSPQKLSCYTKTMNMIVAIRFSFTRHESKTCKIRWNIKKSIEQPMNKAINQEIKNSSKKTCIPQQTSL